MGGFRIAVGRASLPADLHRIGQGLHPCPPRRPDGPVCPDGHPSGWGRSFDRRRGVRVQPPPQQEEVYTDWQKLLELNQKRGELSKKLEELYTEWKDSAGSST